MRKNDCSSISEVFESAVQTLLSKKRILEEKSDNQYNFTLLMNATILQIEDSIVKLDDNNRIIITNALNQLRVIVEQNNNDEYTKTAKLMFSALLVDYILTDFINKIGLTLVLLRILTKSF